MATTYASYSTTLNQTSAFSYTSGANASIFFDFTAFNVSNTYSTMPVFEVQSSPGFNASAIATLSIPATKLNQLFYFEGTYEPNSNYIDVPAFYGVNMSYNFSDLSYSNASVTAGSINLTNTITPILKADYVNYLAYAITGGYNLADIFSNQTALLSSVVSLDASFTSSLNTSLKGQTVAGTAKVVNVSTNYGYGNVYFDTSANGNPFVMATKVLLDGLLGLAGSNNPRGETFLNDIAAQNASTTNASAEYTGKSYYWIPFHTGDTLAILINYVPSTGNGAAMTNLGDNLVYTRSYKILLNCT
jgi:hypothetical protein